MVFKIGELLEEGKFNWKGLNRILHRHEARLDALEGKTDSDTVYDDTEIQASVSALETAVGDSEGGLVKDVADIQTAIGDESTEGTILARIKALEDAE